MEKGMKDKELMITLYPTNWLYNAGVVGFLDIISNDKKFLKNLLDSNISFKINDLKNELFDRKVKYDIPFWHYYYILHEKIKILAKTKSNKQEITSYNYENKKIKIDVNYYDSSKIENDSIKEFLYIYRKYIASLFSKNCLYANYYPPSKINNLNDFISYFNFENIFKKKSNNNKCNFCNNNLFEAEPLDSKFMNDLMPSKEFPNSFWNCKPVGIDNICSLCKFILIHHHLAFRRLSDNSQIFINAPSFKIMYEMNNLVNEIYGKGEASRRQIREILAMSIIEYSRKLNVSLGLWEQMNLEIIIKDSYGIDSFSLPTQIVNLIADRQIASLLSDIGEFSILNTVLNGEFDKLLNFTYKFIKIGLKQNNERNKNDNKYISSYLYKGKNKSNLINISQKILKLYTIINERRKIYG